MESNWNREYREIFERLYPDNDVTPKAEDATEEQIRAVRIALSRLQVVKEDKEE